MLDTSLLRPLSGRRRSLRTRLSFRTFRTFRAFKAFKALESLTALTVLALSVSASATAATLSLVPTSQTVGVSPGDLVRFDVVMDFSTDENGLGSDVTLGGGFDIAFDASHLAFVSLSNANLGDPAFERGPDLQPGLLESWGFAEWNGLTGPVLVGSVVFQVLPNGPPTSAVSTQATSGIAGPFVSDVDFTTQLNVDFDSVDVIDAPEPGLGQMLFAGVAGLLAIGRRGRPPGRPAKSPNRNGLESEVSHDEF